MLNPSFVTTCVMALLSLSPAVPAFGEDRPERGLQVLVMDPLAAPLACPCVEGYAQRKYERLAEYLERRTGQRTQITFADALGKARQGSTPRRIDVIIGKDSVVRADALAAGIGVTAVANLTGQDGSLTQTGLVVVRADSPARHVRDLQGYRIFFGAAQSAEKHDAAIALLKSAGVKLPDQVETTAQCSEGACRVIELGAGVRAAAVISSYAKPLLEGCGTVKKGELRAIGETQPVPFIVAFLTQTVSPADRHKITEALLAVGEDAALCTALETLIGFVPIEGPPAKMADAHEPLTSTADEGWTGWRGPRRNGICPFLPKSLPEQLQVVWERKLAGPGLGGIAATEQYVILGDRDLENACDVFRCLNAADGTPLWTVQYPAIGKLDYGNTPRATPLIAAGCAYLFGAFGDLHCVRLDTGEILWMKNLPLEFGDPAKLVWGTCSSPLLADGKLIVNPGAPEASLAALEPRTGEVLWQTPGGPAGFGSLILATFGGVRQIVGHDRKSLGGWDLATGKRLWTLLPPNAGDFNVPTPLQVGDRLLVTTEHNGTRLYAFDGHGKIIAEPVAQNDDLAPDISTPVVVHDRVYCVWKDLYCLDVQAGLTTLWTGTDKAFRHHGNILASDERLLVIGAGGELVLVDARSATYAVVSRLRVFDDGPTDSYAHPALVGRRLYLRGETALVCLAL